MLNFLSNHLVVATLALVTLLVLLLLGLIVSAASRGAGEGGAANADSKLRLLGAESLRQSFRGAVKLIESNLAARSERYQLSWTLLLNESALRPLPLGQCGLSSALSADSTLSAAAQGIDWHFFDGGVIVQLQAGHLGAPDPERASSNGVWDDFLGLCRGYRPQRPFDSIVLALPCAALLQTDPQGQLDLMARAKAIHRRLWLAQNRLALRFPIYLVVSECDALPGFATFGAALPEPLRRSMLGWSSPYELVAPFRGQWVDSAVDEIVRAAGDHCAELCALEPPGAAVRAAGRAGAGRAGGARHGRRHAGVPARYFRAQDLRRGRIGAVLVAAHAPSRRAARRLLGAGGGAGVVGRRAARVHRAPASTRFGPGRRPQRAE